MKQQMDDFVGLSAVLTGFSAGTIAPTIDPINIKAEYFTIFATEIPNYTEILSEYKRLKGKTNKEIGEALLANIDYEMPCRKLIFLWYSGAWATVNGSMTSSEMLSAKSYTQGLAWQVMQSHPMGDSNYRYGYWANEPADLSGYTGNNN